VADFKLASLPGVTTIVQSMKTLAAISLSLALSCGAIVAAEKKEAVPTAKLSEFTLGAHITGPEVALDQLAGKGVVIEKWGIHCGPCIASLPHIEKIAKRSKDKLVVIGAHSQNATDDEVKEVVKKHRLSYTITKGANGPVHKGTIPHAMVFNTQGELIFSGHPMDGDFDKAVRKATEGVASTSTTGSGLDALKKLQEK
jgi:thiol-disulfide isomerase/thioredoxin